MLVSSFGLILLELYFVTHTPNHTSLDLNIHTIMKKRRRLKHKIVMFFDNHTSK